MQCVLLHGSYSSEDPVKFGVQGCVAGPIRFSLFIDDLPLRVKKKRKKKSICWLWHVGR